MTATLDRLETTETTPAGTTMLIPHLACRNASEAYEFYQKAFGAEPMGIHKSPEGTVMNAILNIDGVMIFLMDEMPECGGVSPQTLGNSPVMLQLQVSDCDAVFNRAVEAGCEVVMPLEDMFWGDRWGMITDPYGHKWAVATTIRRVSEEEIQQAMANMPCGG